MHTYIFTYFHFLLIKKTYFQFFCLQFSSFFLRPYTQKICNPFHLHHPDRIWQLFMFSLLNISAFQCVFIIGTFVIPKVIMPVKHIISVCFYNRFHFWSFLYIFCYRSFVFNTLSRYFLPLLVVFLYLIQVFFDFQLHCMGLHFGLMLNSVDLLYLPPIITHYHCLLIIIPQMVVRGRNGQIPMKHWCCPLHPRTLQHIGNRYL